MRNKTLAVMAIWLSIVGISLYWNLVDDKKESKKIALETARTFFQQIVIDRSWNARHGGVYVPITKTSQPNPYLDDPLRDLTANNGLKLTKINPAYMTRQIAEIAAKEKGIQFHITSLEPIRQENKATDWEKKWLQSFEKGAKEHSEFSYDGSNAIFRYMAPLFVETPCLKCHAKQGYKELDVRGGISVTLPFLSKKRNSALLVGHGIVAISGLILILVGGVLLERNRLSLVKSNEQLKLEIIERQQAEAKIQTQNTELQESLSKVKLLSGFLPICASCKKIRDDKGYWNQIEIYIREHSEAEFSHGICPECTKKLYPDL